MTCVPFTKRLAVRLSLGVVVVVVVFESLLVLAFQTLAPTWPMPAAQRQQLERALERSDSAFGREARAILDDFKLNEVQRRDQLASRLAEQLMQHPEPVDADTVTELLLEVHRPDSWFSPLFLVAWVVLPVAVLSFWLSWRVAGPVAAVAEAADRVTRGDLSTRVSLPGRPKGAKDELALLAERFNTMAETLARLEDERRRMVADIAHELRTPVAIIQAQLDAFEDGIFVPDREEIASLVQETHLLARLIDDLRLLSLADVGRLDLDRRPTDLVALTRSALLGFEAEARDAGISLVLDHAGAEVWGEVDAVRVREVLHNLLGNALRHTPAGGRVSVSVFKGGGGTGLTVSDSGPGIPEGALAHVFNRFYRAEASRSRTTGGSGLGLAIVKTLVELHGGTVAADNRRGGGAQFTVTLPDAREAGREGSRRVPSG